jgi:glucuronate isomerase
MTRQMNALSVLGLLSRFVGMLTDSRSFLSYPRHEYFRRCSATCWQRRREWSAAQRPRDAGAYGQDISYNNARRYFKFY